MSALARLCLFEKKFVTGSELKVTPITEALAAEGVTVTYGQTGDDLPEEIDLVVYTEAIPKDNAERVALKKRGVPMMNYFEALGLAVNDYYLIAVAGTHGKTTTTAMLADVFETAEKDPTVVVGSLRAKTQSNFRGGKSKYAIVEACEYKRDFMSLEPDALVITNIEYEHADYYKNLDEVKAAFADLAKKVPAEGVIVANTDDPNVAEVLSGVTAKTVDYSEFVDPLLQLQAPGMHNLMNAAAALAVARHEGIDLYLAREALKGFTGTWRRFEYKGEYKGAPVIDDYAHHPTEIKVTIKAARERCPDKKILAIFQAHTHSRLRQFHDDFAAALGIADEVHLLPVYGAREEDGKPVSMLEFVAKVTETNGHVTMHESVTDLSQVLEGTDLNNTLILIMGAGDVTEFATRLVQL